MLDVFCCPLQVFLNQAALGPVVGPPSFPLLIVRHAPLLDILLRLSSKRQYMHAGAECCPAVELRLHQTAGQTAAEGEARLCANPHQW